MLASFSITAKATPWPGLGTGHGSIRTEYAAVSPGRGLIGEVHQDSDGEPECDNCGAHDTVSSDFVFLALINSTPSGSVDNFALTRDELKSQVERYEPSITKDDSSLTYR
jgi:hypothetical protein